MADWNSIPYDHCTSYSLYHHPEYLIINSTEEFSAMQEVSNLNYKTVVDSNIPIQIEMRLNLSEDIYFPLFLNMKMVCTRKSVCKEMLNGCNVFQYSSDNLHKKFDNACDILSNSIKNYTCSNRLNLSMCLYVDNLHTDDIKLFHRPNHTIKVQALPVSISKNFYNNMMEKCVGSAHNCHWIPNSIITKRHCSDCQPICRSPSHSLNFAQFCVGATMLMLAIPVAWVPVASLISERTSKDMQVYDNLIDRGRYHKRAFYVVLGNCNGNNCCTYSNWTDC